MRDNLAIVRAILGKTVARGATVGEEEAAVAKAVEMMGKYAIPHSAVASVWPRGWDFQGKRSTEKPRGKPSDFWTQHSKDRELTTFIDFWAELNRQHAIRGLRDADYGEARAEYKRFTETTARRAKAASDAYRATAEKATGSIGDYARQLLLRLIGGKPYSYQWIIESIVLRYPHAKTTVSSLRWYEAEMRKQGRAVPTKRPAK